MGARMRLFWRGPLGGAVTFLLVTLLVAGGLGWATFHALRLEEAQRQAAADLAHAEQVRLALWRLDSRVNLALSREDGRPFGHYSALYIQVTAFNPGFTLWQTGSVYLPSPLMSQELPDWMLLHFQADGRAPGSRRRSSPRS